MEKVKDGVILTLYFDIAQDAQKGVYPVSVRVGSSAVNGDLEKVDITIQDGAVVVG